MCGYSLMSVPNRLAREGEDLVSHWFDTGTMGLACPADLQARADAKRVRPREFWAVLRAFFAPPVRQPVPAVCIPPGARLLLMDISEELQDEFGIGRVEEVTFTQITATAYSHRDAVRFGNGREILLQRLREGQRVLVLALAGDTQDELLGAGVQQQLPWQRR